VWTAPAYASPNTRTDNTELVRCNLDEANTDFAALSPILLEKLSMEQKSPPKTMKYSHAGLKNCAWVAVLLIGSGCNAMTELCYFGPPGDDLSSYEVLKGSAAVLFLAVVIIGSLLAGAWWCRKKQLSGWSLQESPEAPRLWKNSWVVCLSVLAALAFLVGIILWSDCDSWVPTPLWFLGGFISAILVLLLYSKWISIKY